MKTVDQWEQRELARRVTAPSHRPLRVGTEHRDTCGGRERGLRVDGTAFRRGLPVGETPRGRLDARRRARGGRRLSGGSRRRSRVGGGSDGDDLRRPAGLPTETDGWRVRPRSRAAGRAIVVSPDGERVSGKRNLSYITFPNDLVDDVRRFRGSRPVSGDRQIRARPDEAFWESVIGEHPGFLQRVRPCGPTTGTTYWLTIDVMPSTVSPPTATNWRTGQAWGCRWAG